MKLTCLLAAFLQLTLSFSCSSVEACRLKADTACPFIQEPVDVEAQILCRNLRRERVIRPRLDVLSFPDEYLFERFRFSASSIIDLNNILNPHIGHMTHRGHALSSEQILCICSFLYNVGCMFPRQRSVGLSEM